MDTIPFRELVRISQNKSIWISKVSGNETDIPVTTYFGQVGLPQAISVYTDLYTMLPFSIHKKFVEIKPEDDLISTMYISYININMHFKVTYYGLHTKFNLVISHVNIYKNIWKINSPIQVKLFSFFGNSLKIRERIHIKNK